MKNNHKFQCRDKGQKSEAILQKQHFEKSSKAASIPQKPKQSDLY